MRSAPTPRLRRLLGYSSEIAEGRIGALPSSPVLKRQLGLLGRPFAKIVLDLKESQRRLVSMEKEKTWREIAQVMAHEIKNPLTPIRLWVEMIEERAGQLPAGQKEFIDQATKTIGEELQRLENLVNDFRDLSRPVELRKETVNVLDLLRETAAPFLERVQLDIETSKIPKSLELDRGKIQQVLLNLIKNAIEAGATKITVKAKTIPAGIEMNFRDNGRGFPAGLLPGAFLPYMTGKPEGTGLGLSIVKKIIEAHGGSIYAANNGSLPGATIGFSLKA